MLGTLVPHPKWEVVFSDLYAKMHHDKENHIKAPELVNTHLASWGYQLVVVAGMGSLHIGHQILKLYFLECTVSTGNKKGFCGPWIGSC